MWRTTGNIVFKTPSALGRRILQQPHRCSSGASTSGGGAAKALLWTTGALAVGAGGTVGYAWYDPEFRRTIEKNVPQTKDVFKTILGESRDPSKPVAPQIKDAFQKMTVDRDASKSVSQAKEIASLKTAPESPKITPKADAAQKPLGEKSDKSKPVTDTPSKPLDFSSPKKSESVDPQSPKKQAAPSLSDRPKIEPKLEKPPATPELAPALTGVKLQSLNEEYEEELKKHLKRQAAAHADHLEDALVAQRNQLDAQAKRDVSEALIKERDFFNREIAMSIARLNAIEAALEGRAEQDSENRRAKELWLACQHLKKAVLHGRAEGRDYTARRKPLSKEISAIKDAGAADPFVKTLLGTIDSEAVAQGVYTQDDLVDRFQKVKKICRRTALIGENGGTLFQYFLSLVQSVFLFDRVKPDTKQLQEIDPLTIDTVGILWRAAYLVDQLDFDAAIKLMLLLKGEPARLASDWIKDARLHLETRRTAELLLAHASAVSMRTIY